MKAVICCLNSKYIHSSLAPWCLYAGVKAYCPDCISAIVIEGTINEKDGAVLSRIIDEKPDAVGLSTYIWNVTQVLDIARGIKIKLPETTVILGGPEVSYNAHEVLSKNPCVDYVISGEGEKSFAQLLNCLEKDIVPRDVSGVCYRRGEKIIESEPCVCDGEPVSPYCDEYFISLKGRIAYIETSRGCPYSCAFCLSGRCGKVRLFDVERAEENILKLSQSGTKTIKFVDRTFNANKKHASEIITFIIENYGKNIPTGVCFHFEMAGDILDNEMITMLSSAPKGSIQLEIGLQTFNEKTLEYICRKTSAKKLITNINRLIASRNMHIHIDLIAGLPFEDLESFKSSFNIAFDIKPDMLQLGFLKLLHGADMREDVLKYPCKFSNEPPYEVLETPYISADELKRLHKTEDALERIYNSHRFCRALNYVLEVSGTLPFNLFDGFSQYIGKTNTENMRLDDYTKLVFEYFKSLNNVDTTVLRDKMVCDRLASNASGVLPDCLKVNDAKLKKYRNKLNLSVGFNKNGKRGVAILYSENCVVYTDYLSRDEVTGEFQLNYVSFDTLL